MPDFGLPAAFRRLCVETFSGENIGEIEFPAAFRRLCVETFSWSPMCEAAQSQPPSGGCVLKLAVYVVQCRADASRLQAAVC